MRHSGVLPTASSETLAERQQQRDAERNEQIIERETTQGVHNRAQCGQIDAIHLRDAMVWTCSMGLGDCTMHLIWRMGCKKDPESGSELCIHDLDAFRVILISSLA